MKLKSLILPLAAVMALSSCSEKKWSAEGTITGGAGKTIKVEASNGVGGWYAIDEVAIASDGTFKVAGLPFGHPELLRLSVDGQSIYLPIDSIESVSVSADAKNIASSARLSGSSTAEKLQEVNDMIAKAIAANGEDAASLNQDLKRSLAEVILRDPSDIVAYYLVFHRVGNNLLFSPEDKSDLRIIGAVANAYTQNRPSDPRTQLLKDLYLSNRKIANNAPSDTLVAQEVKFPEIILMDETGKTRSLSDVAGNGKVVLLSFTIYSADWSSALNVELNKLYAANKGAGFEIYQIGYDGDEFAWKQSAKNLPWITVYNAPKVGDKVLIDYNVDQLPALFILNRQGDLVERVDQLNRLSAAVGRYL